MTSQVAENYQLKWHSHLSNLNSSVATLYRSEKYADVLLFTSNSDSTAGIPAHKLILGSCSHYFASIFEVNPTPPNTMIYIVLPPELSKRSIQILIQYMYSGEATVSNDILNEVLRGGEVLKIRGLWRNNQTSEPNASSTPQYHQSKIVDPTPMVPSCVKDNQVIVEKSVFEHRAERVRESMNSSSVVKESPVIVMSPQQQPQIQSQQPQHQIVHQQHQTPAILPQSTSLPPASPHQQINTVSSQSIQSIQVKKELTPEQTENPVPALHYGLVSLQIAAAVKKAQMNNETRIKSTSGAHENGTSSGGISSIRRYSMDQQAKDNHHDANSHHVRSKESEILRMSNDKQRLSNADQQRAGHHLEPGEKSQYPGKIIVDKKSVPTTSTTLPAIESSVPPAASEVQIPEALSFLTIKQEPVEWAEYDLENGIEKSHIEVAVKPEIVYGNEETEEEEEQDEMVYSPLTCELCSETFTIPAEWVRHIEGHAETTHCVPKKRKRVDETTSENIAALRCDLCSTHFVTPAEWVRHVQNTHTETELALSNNSNPPKRNQRTVRPLDGQPLEKTCVVCKKSFPSYASMIIHKRTHTGERPFYCTLCEKGFNVKSNLLRHMRTLHNQLLNPSNIIDCQDEMNPE